MNTNKMHLAKGTFFMAVIGALFFMQQANAAITKANNATNLNLGGSWMGGTAPGSGDIALWDITSDGTGSTAALGVNVNWGGIQITNVTNWITISTGSTITLGSSGVDMSIAANSMTINPNVTLGASQTWSVAATRVLAIPGIVSGAQPLIKSGSGTLIFANANTFSNNLSINGGIVQVGDNGNEYATGLGTGTGAVAVNTGATLWLKPGVTANSYSFANSFVINGGTIIGEDGVQHLATGAGATFTIGASGGTVAPTYSFKDVYIDGILSGSGILVLAHGPTASGQSAGVRFTNPANSFSGTVKDSASAQDLWINIDNNTALQYATVNLVTSGAGKPYVALNSPGTTTVGGLTGSAGIVWTNTVAGTYTLNVNNAANSTFGGTLQNNTGVLAMTKSGAGTLTLSGNNTNSGMITVNAGTLSLTGTPTSNALKYTINGGAISVADRLNLSPIPASFTADWVTINGGTFSTAISIGNGYSGNRGFTLGALGGTIEIPNTYNSNVVPISSVITGPGALTKTGVGTLNLQGANTYSGNTTVSTGTLQLGAASVIPNGAGKGNVAVSGTLDLISFSDTINGLTGSGIIRNSASGSSILTIGNNNATSSFNGVIKDTIGTLAINKIGTGTLTLSGANTYSGATTLTAGTLLLTNTFGSATGTGSVTCNGGTLGGTGIIGGAVTVNSGATISPGVAGIGALTINNNLTLKAGCAYAVDLKDSVADNINIVGGAAAVTLGNATLSINLISAPIAGRSFVILHNSNPINGTFSGLAEGATISAAFGGVTYKFTVSYVGGTGSDIVLTVASKPSITTQPTNQSVIALTNATFSLQATGTMPLTYTWMKNGTTPVGINNDSLSLLSVSAADDNSWYQCQVKNTVDSVLSAACTLHVITSIGNISYSQKFLSAVINTAFIPDTPTVVGNVSKYSISPQLPSGVKIDSLTGIISGTPTIQVDSTIYTIAASNGSGGNSTANLGIKVFSPIKVTTSPVSQTAAVKGSGKFFVVANGSKPYTYTWMSINPAGPVGGNSDTLTLTGIDTTFNGKSYKCIVQNSFQNNTYFDTSKACTLHVILPPKITTQPAAQTVLRNSKPVFSVTAGGTPPFSYVWIRNGTDTVGISNPDTLGLVAAINDKSTYRCIARNVSGADISALCTLRVVSAAFGGSPQSGLDSLTVAFVDSSTGGVSVRKWDFGDGTADSVQNPKHKYTVPNTYAVKLKVTSGAVSDSLIKANFVTVSYSKPKPNFSGTPITAQDSITVKFTDLSTGAVTSRQWSFGDSAVDTAKNPVHTYTKPGSFTVTLTVTGPGGTASSVQAAYIYVYSKKDNPIRIAGRRLSTTKVELTFTNYDSIPTSKSTQPPPWADSVGLYFRRDSLPSSTQAGTLVQTMNIPLIQGLARPFKDTVTVSYSGPADSVYYGFATALNWSDATKSAIAGGNATLVFMKDTAHFGNGLVISGAYLGVDTAGINLDKISGLDTGAIDSVELWYGFRDSANFSDASYTRKFSAISVINAAFGNRFTYKVRDPRFNSDTVSIFAAVELIGKNRLTSPENDTSFVVGRVRPQNPIKLTAKATSPSVIKLSWNKITGFDRIRIWKGLSAVPPGPDNITSSQYDTLIPNPTDTVMSVTGLTAKTWYFFGAQALQNNLWSTVTDSASAKDSTPAAVDTTKIVNTIKIRKFVFDSTRGALVIAWHVDTLDTNFKVGIEYSLKGYPTDSTIAPTQTAIIKSKTDSAVVTLKEPLALNATYYASMWISKGAKWALPTDSSKAKTTTPLNAPWQLVRYFDAAHDTVFAFGGRVMLASESMTDTFLIADTLRLFSATVSGLNGLVPVSVGFSFTNASDRLNVGLKVDTLLIPKGYTFADVRIYRQDSTGLYAVENGTVLNAAGGSVWLLTKDLGNPFIAMINTMKPNVKILNSLAGAVLANRALYDTIQITDNILNDSWVFRYTKGANSYANADDTSGSTWGLIDTIIVKASATSVNGGSGLRAMFVTSNGVHSDTQNVSRQVVRDSSANVVSTTEMQWTPLWVTAQLADSTAKIALKGLAGKNGWVYDNTQFRLFRWYAYPGNSAMDDKYLEYADSISDLFYFKPGRLFWLKTRTHSVFQLGSGITSDLNKAVSLTIEPHQMADIAVPYDFPLLVGDIIASTNANSQNISETGDSLIGDSLYYYNFILDAATNKYHTELLYINDGRLNKTAPMSKTDTLTSGFFCVYNPFKTSVSLSIPGIPAVMSKQSALSKKTQASEGWSVRVVGRTSEGSVLSSVYCGQVNGAPSPIKYYPAVQLIDGAGIRVCDQNLRQWGHAMARGDCAKDGGVTYLLAFTGTTGSLEKITYHAENTDGLPKGLRAIVLDPGSDSVAEASTELRASVGDFRKLVIGNDSYIAKAKAINKFYRLALVGVSPNPFGRMLRIRYSLPYTGVSRVEFSMIDLRGREFWALHGQTGAGPRELVWNGLGAGKHPVAAGMYVLRMKALDDKGKIAGVFQKRVTYLP